MSKRLVMHYGPFAQGGKWEALFGQVARFMGNVYIDHMTMDRDFNDGDDRVVIKLSRDGELARCHLSCEEAQGMRRYQDIVPSVYDQQGDPVTLEDPLPNFLQSGDTVLFDRSVSEIRLALRRFFPTTDVSLLLGRLSNPALDALELALPAGVIHPTWQVAMEIILFGLSEDKLSQSEIAEAKSALEQSLRELACPVVMNDLLYMLLSLKQSLPDYVHGVLPEPTGGYWNLETDLYHETWVD